MQGRAATELNALEDYYNRLQSSYAKLTVTHFTLQSQSNSADVVTDPLLETENDSILEEKEVDELHTGEMAGLGAKWEADAEAEDERLITARAAVARLTNDLSSLTGQDLRLAGLKEELVKVNGRARRLKDAESRKKALERRRQRVVERRTRLEQQKKHHDHLKKTQDALRQELLMAKEDQANMVVAEEKANSRRELILQLLI